MNNSEAGQERIWEHFQNEGVASFDHSTGRLEFLAKQLRPTDRVLNIGVGNGLLERIATSRNIAIWSLDPSERAITRLRETLSMGERAKTGLSQNIPFDQSTFDVVIMSEVLEHLDDEVLTATLGEVSRTLRAGGKFIGTVPARENLNDSLVVCPCCGTKFHRWGHKQQFDIERLSALLSEHFHVEKISERFFVDWESASWKKRTQGLMKKLLSWAGLGTYGANRNIYFSARTIKVNQL